VGRANLLLKVKLTLRSTVSWPVNLGVKPHPRPQNQIFVTVKLRFCRCGAPSPKRGRVCIYRAQSQQFFFLRCYSPSLDFGLPPWNSPFYFGLVELKHSVGLLGRVISSSQGLYFYLYRKTHIHMQTLKIHALSGIRTHVHALDRSAAIISSTCHLYLQFYMSAFYIVSCQVSGFLWVHTIYSFTCT
jgi:hypothetical protein